MERKIGEVFEYRGRKLKVVEAVDTCKGCFFENNCSRDKLQDVAGDCFERKDKKDVIFVDAFEEQEQKQTEQKEEPRLNLLEKLKYCPEGTKFWSPILGKVEFICVKNESIKVYEPTREYYGFFTANGNFDFGVSLRSEECLLFPSREQRDWGKVEYKAPLDTLPKTWDEFCKTHNVEIGEAYIDEFCDIEVSKETTSRDVVNDCNYLPNIQAAKQHLAHMKLHQLRDCWRHGWKPNDANVDGKYPFAIVNNPTDGGLRPRVGIYTRVSRFLAFQDEERAQKFLECFRDLIEEAGDLI